ncbi:unnamed protein product [Closterium sp. NIES-54]
MPRGGQVFPSHPNLPFEMNHSVDIDSLGDSPQQHPTPCPPNCDSTDGGEMTISLGLDQRPQMQLQRTSNAAAADRSVSEARYSDDATTTTGDICDKEEGRLLLAGACDNRENVGGASAADEATAAGDGHGTNAALAPAPAPAAPAAPVGDIQEEAEEGERDDGEPSLWSALTFAWVGHVLPARLLRRLKSHALPARLAAARLHPSHSLSSLLPSA